MLAVCADQLETVEWLLFHGSHSVLELCNAQVKLNHVFTTTMQLQLLLLLQNMSISPPVLLICVGCIRYQDMLCSLSCCRCQANVHAVAL